MGIVRSSFCGDYNGFTVYWDYVYTGDCLKLGEIRRMLRPHGLRDGFGHASYTTSRPLTQTDLSHGLRLRHLSYHPQNVPL